MAFFSRKKKKNNDTESFIDPVTGHRVTQTQLINAQLPPNERIPVGAGSGHHPANEQQLSSNEPLKAFSEKNGNVFYKVQPGDNFSKIAATVQKDGGPSAAHIETLNHITNTHELKVGQEINLGPGLVSHLNGGGIMWGGSANPATTNGAKPPENQSVVTIKINHNPPEVNNPGTSQTPSSLSNSNPETAAVPALSRWTPSSTPKENEAIVSAYDTTAVKDLQAGDLKDAAIAQAQATNALHNAQATDDSWGQKAGTPIPVETNVSIPHTLTDAQKSEVESDLKQAAHFADEAAAEHTTAQIDGGLKEGFGRVHNTKEATLYSDAQTNANQKAAADEQEAAQWQEKANTALSSSNNPAATNVPTASTTLPEKQSPVTVAEGSAGATTETQQPAPPSSIGSAVSVTAQPSEVNAPAPAPVGGSTPATAAVPGLSPWVQTSTPRGNESAVNAYDTAAVQDLQSGDFKDAAIAQAEATNALHNAQSIDDSWGQQAGTPIATEATVNIPSSLSAAQKTELVSDLNQAKQHASDAAAEHAAAESAGGGIVGASKLHRPERVKFWTMQQEAHNKAAAMDEQQAAEWQNKANAFLQNSNYSGIAGTPQTTSTGQNTGGGSIGVQPPAGPESNTGLVADTNAKH